ncbi:hypothetical protein MJN54_32570, partial [Salmonella enterica subsp. enterica serovar Kentucky]|nr:hypothetical protein [Salmonella enterica subsp. enterica serovar Kentucky]
STLPLKGAELDLLIVMKRTSDRPRPAMPATVWVQVEVADSPHPHTPDGGFKRIRHTEQNENTPTASPVGQGLRTYPTGNALKGV